MKWLALTIGVAAVLCLGRIWQRMTRHVAPDDARRRLRAASTVSDDWLSDHFRREWRFR